MRRSWNILVAESKDFAPEAKQVLMRLGNVAWEDLAGRELCEHLDDKEILWVRLRSRIDASILDSAPKLKIIASPTTGLTHIDMKEAESRDIRVVSLKGEHRFLRGIRATAELTIGLILSLIRHIPESIEHVHKGGWNRDLFRGTELYGRRVGVVGYGRLGRIVARYLSTFGSDVMVADPRVNASELEPSTQLLGLDELLERSEIVTCHADLNATTHGLFGREQFGRMKPGSYFINTSRGEVVDELALLEALESGGLAGAAVDVVCNEHQFETSPLIGWARTHSNLIISPHIGGCTVESMARTEMFLAERLCDIASTIGATQ